MNKKNEISFVSFANSRYASQERIKREAEEMHFFEHIYVGDEHMLEPWYYKKYKDRWPERSFGYWQWKPYLIRRVMDRMEEGDFLVYADAGCTLNPRGIPRLKEYLHMVEENACGVLGFDQHFREAEWTKADLFDYFGVLGDPKYMDHGQVASGCIIIHKKPASQRLIDEWHYIMHFRGVLHRRRLGRTERLPHLGHPQAHEETHMAERNKLPYQETIPSHTMSANYAYVTMATSKNYLPGLMAMYLSLKQTGTHIPLYAMLPHNLVVAEPKAIDSLQKSGVNILKYSHSVDIPQQLIDNNATQGDHRFSHTFDKLLIFGLTQFDKIVFLDADIQILHSLDHLFNMPHMSAMIAGRSYPGNEDWIDLTSGIMTIIPQTEECSAPKTLAVRGIP